jgi:hypothetical protein
MREPGLQLTGTGELLLGEIGLGLVLAAVGRLAGGVFYRDFSRRCWKSVVEQSGYARPYQSRP